MLTQISKMKFLLIIFILALLPCAGRAQTVPATFLDIKWGGTSAEAKAGMARQPDAKLSEENTERLIYAGGTFAGKPVSKWHLDFADGQFYEAILTFEYSGEHTDKGYAMDILYGDLRESITKKYGKKFHVESAGDHCATKWTFPDTPLSKGAKEIRLYHSWADHILTLTYKNLLFEKAAKAAKGPINDI